MVCEPSLTLSVTTYRIPPTLAGPLPKASSPISAILMAPWLSRSLSLVPLRPLGSFSRSISPLSSDAGLSFSLSGVSKRANAWCQKSVTLLRDSSAGSDLNDGNTHRFVWVRRIEAALTSEKGAIRFFAAPPVLHSGRDEITPASDRSAPIRALLVPLFNSKLLAHRTAKPPIAVIVRQP